MQKLLAMVRRLLGLDAPKRDIPLIFVLPKISDRVVATQVIGGGFGQDLKNADESPAEYFGVLKTRIRYLNRCDLKPALRLDVTREVLGLFYAKALEQMTRQARVGAIPESEQRKLILSAVIDIAQILGVSYQILFSHYYKGSAYAYNRSHHLVLESASRILELLNLKQQALALRYQLLNEVDWQAANSLFYVMSVYEDVLQAAPTLKQALKLETADSYCELYAALHLVARFDPLRWPTHLQWIVKSYMKTIANGVSVRVGTAGDKIGRDNLISYRDSTASAGIKPQDKPLDQALIFACGTLFAAIRKDCLSLIKAAKTNRIDEVPERFAAFKESERFIISEQLFIGLDPVEDGIKSARETNIDDLRIFVGFSAVFALLQHRQSDFASEERLADALAKRSAVMAEDHHATKNSMWSLLFKDERMMRLSTQESGYTTAMAIGSLLAYGIGDEVNRPSLAVVSRIFRPSGKSVVIDITCIANYAEAVVFSLQSGKNEQGKQAILVHDKLRSNQWDLIVRPIDVLFGFDNFLLHRKRVVHAFNLETVRNATPDFSLFSTNLTTSQLDFLAGPDYAAVSPAK